jgi:hypothetical protein
VAGVAGLEPVTSAVTGQRSNQLSYTPRIWTREIKRRCFPSQSAFQKIRAADAKEVGVENPAEETYCHPNQIEPMLGLPPDIVNLLADEENVPHFNKKERVFSE